jgi:glycosyltransferase involved in cell wall biosynthesis
MPIKISVIIPVYNASQFVTKAVESALIQHEVAEVLLIEDSSQDNSLQVCQQLARKYNKVHLYTHLGNGNKGAGASRNLGIENAKYDFIAFLDADDFYLPGRFKHCRHIFRDASVEGVYGCVKAEFDTPELKQKFLSRYESEYTTTSERIEPEDLLYKLLFGGGGRFHTNAVTLRKTVFNKTAMFDTELKMAQDSELWARLAATCKLVPGQIEQPVAVRRIHASNRIHADEAVILKYKTMMYSKLLVWGINQKQLPFGKRNYFFLLYKNHGKWKGKPLNLLWNLLLEEPKLLVNSFFYRKIYQVLAQY